MLGLSAQVSLYPLRKVELEAEIDEVIRIFHTHELEVTTGPMSTLLMGEGDQIFTALKEALEYATAQGHMVMVVTFTNACPMPTNE